MSSETWAANEQEAKLRASKYRDKDPFQTVIPQALLSGGHISMYAERISLIYPAHGLDKTTGLGKGGTLKTASYETRPGKVFYRYDDEGKLIRIDLSKTKKRFIHLPANSITYVSTEDKFFLPNYIALRFNLRIKHVHRGLLLGTGPLVDPGFFEDILIPLHNLTDEDYYISLDEGLIWIEFTKTSRDLENRFGREPENLPGNTTKTLDEFLFKANVGRPIRSSINTSIQKSEKAVESAREEIERVRRFGALAILTAVVGLVAVFTALLNLIHNTRQLVEDTRVKLEQLEAPKP
jgi:deoxycytidine triphosphate deaminase